MDREKKIRQRIIVIAALCLLFFVMGMSIPLLMKKPSSESNTEMDKFETVYNLLTDKWYYANQVEELDNILIEKAISGMTMLEEDPHTNYFSLQEAEAFSQALSGSNVGVGFVYSPDDNSNFVIQDVFVGSSADTAGLQRGDIITQVDSMVCSENPSEDIVAYIQKKEGKQINVKFTRDGNEESVKVTPGSYDTTVICRMHDDYAEIILSSFSEKTGETMAAALGRVQKAGIKKLILDLRDNTGGYLSAEVDVASSFLPEKTVVYKEKLADGTIKEYKTNDTYGQVELDQIVILQNENTASASEALIGALKDIIPDKITTVGLKTYGKGTEQVSIAFKDGTSIKYTVAEWLTPNETSINNVGFEPDVPVDSILVASVDYTEMAEDESFGPDSVHYNATALQTFLDFLGYPVDRTDMYFSPASSQSLAQFQAENGLEATGVCDYQTWEVLKDKVVKEYNARKESMDEQRNKAIELLG